MALRMEGQPLLLQLAVWACVVVYVVSFLTVLYSIFIVLWRTNGLVDRAEDRELGWGERQGRKFSRVSRFLVADEFRSVRMLAFGACAGAAMSFGLLVLLVVSFGEQMPK